MKNSKNEAAATHTVPGKPIFFLIGMEISTSDNLIPESVQKTSLTVPISLSDFWCSVNGNTVSFDFTGYAGSNYGAIKFDVLYI